MINSCIKPAIMAVIAAAFLSGCSFFSGSQNQFSQDDADAWLILRKGNMLIAQNQLPVAERMLTDCYKKFSLIDDRNGKMKALRGLAKIYAFQADSVKLERTLEKMRDYSGIDPYNSTEFNLARTEEFYRKGQMDSILALNKNPELLTSAEPAALILIYYLNAQVELKQDYSKTENLLRTRLNGLISEGLEKLDDPLISGFGYYTLSLSALNKGEILAAEDYISKAFNYDRILSNSRGLAEDYILESEILKKHGKTTDASVSLLQASEIFGFLQLDYDALNCKVSAYELFVEKIPNSTRAELEKIAQDTTFPDIRGRILGILRKN